MAENTFLGLQPYTEADAYRFKGRTEESQELFRLIVRNDYTVCYAESGEGKTSLLNAGVFPLLRQNMYFPIAITFTSDDYEHTPDNFDTIIDRCIRDSITEYNETNKGVNVEYKLCSTDFQDTDRQSALQQELGNYSWWKLRNYKPQAMGLTFTPVFVFDQFEEVFNLPGSIVWTKKFFDWLEDVSSDSCPDKIVNKVREIIGTDAAFPAIKEDKDFKAVFSLRKEFIGELDYWSMQQCFIPGLKDNRYCLKALTFEGAKNVMTQQQRFPEDKVEQVLCYFVQQYSREPEKTIGENLPIIPALLLSVVCNSWEKDINYFSNINTNGIDDSLNKILEKFYDEALSAIVNELTDKKVKNHADSICHDIETAIFALVDPNGKRVRRKSSELSHLDFDAKYKEILNDKRIVKISKIDGEDYVEIVHDSLCPIIAKRKELFLASEAKKREEKKLRMQAKKNRKRMMIATMIGLVIIGILLFSLWQNNRFLKEQEARTISEVEKDSISKLNNSLTEQISINEIQKDSLNKQLSVNELQKDSLNVLLRINNVQRDSLNKQLRANRAANKVLEEISQSLHERNRILSDQKDDLRKQRDEIEKQRDAIAKQRDEIGRMNIPVGSTARYMEKGRPESILSNILTDVLLWEGKTFNENPDFAVYHINGIRSALNEGVTTYTDIVNVAPFDNKICFVTLTGTKVMELFQQIAKRKGEGVSHGVELIISNDGRLLSGRLNGKEIDPNREYRIATLDYMAAGNDGLYAFEDATDVVTPEGYETNVRFLIMKYWLAQSSQGKSVDGKIEGRIVIK